MPAFMFATGIENSIPTIKGGAVRVDQMDVCGHYKLWQTDFTYLKIIGCGCYYLSTVLDDFSRYIVAWRLGPTINSNPDEPEPPFAKRLISLKLSDDGQFGGWRSEWYSTLHHG